MMVLIEPGHGFHLLLRPPLARVLLPGRPRALHPAARPLQWRSASTPRLLHASRFQDEEEEDATAVGKMALWELFRELERRGVVYSVLQPREELTRLLLDARRGSGGSRIGLKTEGEEGGNGGLLQDAGPSTAAAAAAAADKEEAGEQSVTAASAPPPPVLPPVPPPAFASIADALAWAGKLSREEIAVELDFMGVPQDGFDEEPTHSQLARLLARAVMGQGAEEASSSSSSSSSSRSAAPPLPQPKSKARQQRLIRELQRGDDGEGRHSPSQPLPARRQQRRRGQGRRSPGAGRYGGEERFLDVDHAREELVAMRDRALDALGVGAGAAESLGNQGGRRAGGRKKKAAARYDAVRDRLELGMGGGAPGDVALRVFEKATRVADRALDWATRARGMARGAMIAATTADGDVDPRSPGAKSVEALRKLELQKKSQALLGSRGRRWSKFGGMMARAWAESVWQVVMASASWAGGGLLPGKYVLLGAGAFSLLLRQGLSTYVATLLVVRTCSSTLRNIIEDEEKPLETF